MEFNKDELWLLKGFKYWGIERTEDVIKSTHEFTESKKKYLLTLRKQLIWRILLEVK